MGLRTNTGAFDTPNAYTPKLSALVTTSKLVILYKAFLDCRPANWRSTDEPACGVYQLVKDWTPRMLVPHTKGGQCHPIDWCIQLRNYGQCYSALQPSNPRIAWNLDTMLFGQLQLSATLLLGTIKALRTATYNPLLETCLVQVPTNTTTYNLKPNQLPPLDLAGLVDNPNNNNYGFSFLDHADNADLFGDPKDHLHRRIDLHDGLRGCWRHRHDPTKYNRKCVGSYLNRVEELRAKLLVLI
jgi:hypothetical protein